MDSLLKLNFITCSNSCSYGLNKLLIAWEWWGDWITIWWFSLYLSNFFILLQQQNPKKKIKTKQNHLSTPFTLHRKKSLKPSFFFFGRKRAWNLQIRSSPVNFVGIKNSTKISTDDHHCMVIKEVCNLCPFDNNYGTGC